MDQDNQPVSGAEVRISSHPTEGESNSEVPHISLQAGEKTRTDAGGRWRFSRFAREAVFPKTQKAPLLTFQVKHPDYFEDIPFLYGGAPPEEVQTQLLTGAFVLRLARVATLRGMVVDTNGQPVPNVKLTLSDPHYPSGSRVLTNQNDGTFTMEGCRSGTNSLCFQAAGLALTRMELNLEPDVAPLRVTLPPAKLLLLRIADRNGRPVAGATVSCSYTTVARDTPAGRQVHFVRAFTPPFSRLTDRDGRVQWESPPDGQVLFDVAAPGLRRASATAKADGEEHVITLAPALTILGSVRDAAAGEPIPHFRICVAMPAKDGVTGRRRVSWDADRDFNDGQFRLIEDSDQGRIRVFKFEAEGYAPFVTRDVQIDEGEVRFEVTLQPAARTPVLVRTDRAGHSIASGLRRLVASGRQGQARTSFDRRPGALPLAAK
jgi:protocatechuate 3,4-dioxygenase beta subunit